jgi:hypothetical protein
MDTVPVGEAVTAAEAVLPGRVKAFGNLAASARRWGTLDVGLATSGVRISRGMDGGRGGRILPWSFSARA